METVLIGAFVVFVLGLVFAQFGWTILGAGLCAWATMMFAMAPLIVFFMELY